MAPEQQDSEVGDEELEAVLGGMSVANIRPSGAKPDAETERETQFPQ